MKNKKVCKCKLTGSEWLNGVLVCKVCKLECKISFILSKYSCQKK